MNAVPGSAQVFLVLGDTDITQSIKYLTNCAEFAMLIVWIPEMQEI